MKIGEFSRVNKISIETVRHYIDLGLVIPYKNKSQYEFNEKCQKELEYVLNLKSLGFTLNEIKSIFIYETLGKLNDAETNNVLQDIFTLKQKEIRAKITELLEGKLKCSCGMEYGVESGILIIDKYSIRKGNREYRNIIEDYIKETDENYILNVIKALDWIYNELLKVKINNKVILEIGSGLGFLLRNIYDDLDDNSIYIAVDNNIEKHIYLKALIERSKSKKNIMFICTDFKYIPIRNDSIDLFLDYSGSSNYWFENNDFSIKDIMKYLKKDAYLGLVYIILKKIALSNFIKEENRKNFNINYIKEELNKYNLKKISEQKSDTLNKPSIYEDYFQIMRKFIHIYFLEKGRINPIFFIILFSKFNINIWNYYVHFCNKLIYIENNWIKH